MDTNPYEFYRHRNAISRIREDVNVIRKDVTKENLSKLHTDIDNLYNNLAMLFGDYFKR